jgi:integrase
MVLRVVGKRNKERILPLTESILQMLREVWKTHHNRKGCDHVSAADFSRFPLVFDGDLA